MQSWVNVLMIRNETGNHRSSQAPIQTQNCLLAGMNEGSGATNSQDRWTFFVSVPRQSHRRYLAWVSHDSNITVPNKMNGSFPLSSWTWCHVWILGIFLFIVMTWAMWGQVSASGSSLSFTCHAKVCWDFHIYIQYTVYSTIRQDCRNILISIYNHKIWQCLYFRDLICLSFRYSP